MAQQVLTRPITRLEALELVHDMLLLDTPEYQIRNAMLQYGFYRDEIDDIIYDARSFNGMAVEHNIHPSMMALGLTVVTVIMLLMVIGLLITAIL